MPVSPTIVFLSGQTGNLISLSAVIRGKWELLTKNVNDVDLFAMILLLQRVSEASITIDRRITAQIGKGLLVLLGVQPHDTDEGAMSLVTRMLKYRIFGDDAGKMNLSLLQIDGGLLMVPQFTLAADTRHGLRPGFSTAAPPTQGQRLFEVAVGHAKAHHGAVQTGTFGADMQVSLVNDGPVTFWLEG